MSTITETSTPAVYAPPIPRYSLQQIQQIWGWIFLSPWIIGFLAFTLIPIAASLVFSFTDFNLNRPDNIQWVGFSNYTKLTIDPVLGLNGPAIGECFSSLVSEPKHLTALCTTFRFALIALPLSIILPVGLASLLNSKNLMAKRIFRTLFYMPYMVPAVSAVYIWGGMLNSGTGWINRFLGSIGVMGPNWLDDINWIYPALYIIGLWGIGNAMLITLASMQGVPTELYEAATVDGAGPFSRFRRITLPMISPVIFYNLVLSVIGLFRYFEIPYILKAGQGDPGGSTMFFNIHLYKTAFTFKDMGYGAAMAWLLFAMATVATLLLFFSARYWVYYAGGEES